MPPVEDVATGELESSRSVQAIPVPPSNSSSDPTFPVLLSYPIISASTAERKDVDPGLIRMIEGVVSNSHFDYLILALRLAVTLRVVSCCHREPGTEGSPEAVPEGACELDVPVQ